MLGSTRAVIAELGKRVDDHQQATNRMADTFNTALRQHAEESRLGIRDLSDQLRGEVAALRAEYNGNHKDNIARMWRVAIMVGGGLLVAILSNPNSAVMRYFFPKNSPDVSTAQTLHQIEDTLQMLRQPLNRGAGD